MAFRPRRTRSTASPLPGEPSQLSPPVPQQLGSQCSMHRPAVTHGSGCCRVDRYMVQSTPVVSRLVLFWAIAVRRGGGDMHEATRKLLGVLLREMVGSLSFLYRTTSDHVNAFVSHSS